MTLTVPHMVHLQDVVKLHTFVLGHLGALRLACFGFDLRFALVAFDLVSDSIWCEGVGVGVGAGGGSTWAGGDYLRGALGWERRGTLGKPTKHVRTHTHKLKPLNHFTVVPEPLSPLRFKTAARTSCTEAAGTQVTEGCVQPGSRPSSRGCGTVFVVVGRGAGVTWSLMTRFSSPSMSMTNV